MPPCVRCSEKEKERLLCYMITIVLRKSYSSQIGTLVGASCFTVGPFTEMKLFMIPSFFAGKFS